MPDIIPMFEQFQEPKIFEAYGIDEKDYTKSEDLLREVVTKCLKEIYDDTFDTIVPTQDQLNSKLQAMVTNYGLWWSSSFESDLAKLFKHVTKSSKFLSDFDYAVNSIAAFFWNEYSMDSPDDIDFDAEGFDPADLDIIRDRNLNKSEKIRKLYAKYPPAKIASAIGTTPQVVRNVRKKAREDKEI